MKNIKLAGSAVASMLITGSALAIQDSVPTQSPSGGGAENMVAVAEGSPATSSAVQGEAASPQIVVGNIPAPPTGKGQIIFFRKGGLFGAAISCAVHENGAKITSLPPGKYNVHVAEPGIHQYSVKSEATDTLRIEIEPGETYYSQCNITMGVMAGRPNLSPSDKPAFEKLSAKLKPAINKVNTADSR